MSVKILFLFTCFIFIVHNRRWLCIIKFIVTHQINVEAISKIFSYLSMNVYSLLWNNVSHTCICTYHSWEIDIIMWNYFPRIYIISISSNMMIIWETLNTSWRYNNLSVRTYVVDKKYLIYISEREICISISIFYANTSF